MVMTPRIFSPRLVANLVVAVNCFALVAYGFFFLLSSLVNFFFWPALFTFWIPFALAIIATKKKVSILFFLEILASKERVTSWVAVGANVVWLIVLFVILINANDGSFHIRLMIAYLAVTSPAFINILYLSLRSKQYEFGSGFDSKTVDAVDSAIQQS